MKYDRVYNFSAGPSMLPEPVLEEIRDEFMNYQGSGMCVMEMSHRSKVFEGILHQAEADLRTLMGIPENYKVLFIQGGATLQFSMIPMNLMKNGIEAMSDIPVERRQLLLQAHVQDGRTMEISVADQGHGLAEEDIERIFAPFYTTKPEGMGIGLAICRSIIEFHQGRLWVEPRREGGTIFRFTVPIEEKDD